eukprot:5837367-Pleurochrysis_carterae.AAC.2
MRSGHGQAWTADSRGVVILGLLKQVVGESLRSVWSFEPTLTREAKVVARVAEISVNSKFVTRFSFIQSKILAVKNGEERFSSREKQEGSRQAHQRQTGTWAKCKRASIAVHEFNFALRTRRLGGRNARRVGCTRAPTASKR